MTSELQRGGIVQVVGPGVGRTLLLRSFPPDNRYVPEYHFQIETQLVPPDLCVPNSIFGLVLNQQRTIVGVERDPPQMNFDSFLF